MRDSELFEFRTKIDMNASIKYQYYKLSENVKEILVLQQLIKKYQLSKAKNLYKFIKQLMRKLYSKSIFKPILYQYDEKQKMNFSLLQDNIPQPNSYSLSLSTAHRQSLSNKYWSQMRTDLFQQMSHITSRFNNRNTEQLSKKHEKIKREKAEKQLLNRIFKKDKEIQQRLEQIKRYNFYRFANRNTYNQDSTEISIHTQVLNDQNFKEELKHDIKLEQQHSIFDTEYQRLQKEFQQIEGFSFDTPQPQMCVRQINLSLNDELSELQDERTLQLIIQNRKLKQELAKYKRQQVLQ